MIFIKCMLHPNLAKFTSAYEAVVSSIENSRIAHAEMAWMARRLYSGRHSVRKGQLTAEAYAAYQLDHEAAAIQLVVAVEEMESTALQLIEACSVVWREWVKSGVTNTIRMIKNNLLACSDLFEELLSAKSEILGESLQQEALEHDNVARPGDTDAVYERLTKILSKGEDPRAAQTIERTFASSIEARWIVYCLERSDRELNLLVKRLKSGQNPFTADAQFLYYLEHVLN